MKGQWKCALIMCGAVFVLQPRAHLTTGVDIGMSVTQKWCVVSWAI